MRRSRSACWFCRSSLPELPGCGLRLAVRPRLAAALLALVLLLLLTLLEGAVAQVLLLMDHVAELIELRHHVVVVVAVIHARLRHLQIFHHLLQLLQQLASGVLVAALRKLLQLVEHVFQVALAEHAIVRAERPRQLLRILQLLHHRLHEAVHRRAELIHQLFQLGIAGAALQRLAQRLLGVAQLRLRVADVAVLELHRHRPHALCDVAQLHRRSWRAPATRRYRAARDRRRRWCRICPAPASARRSR